MKPKKAEYKKKEEYEKKEEPEEYEKAEEYEKKEEAEEVLGKQIGKITHYFSKISVGVIELTDTLKVGENIRVKGHETDFTQKVDSMQIEHVSVKEAKKGQSIGLKVADKTKEGDLVYKA